LEPHALHLEHRSLIGEPDAQLDQARAALDLDQLAGDRQRASAGQVDLALVGDLLGSGADLELFLRRRGHETRLTHGTQASMEILVCPGCRTATPERVDVRTLE